MVDPDAPLPSEVRKPDNEYCPTTKPEPSDLSVTYGDGPLLFSVDEMRLRRAIQAANIARSKANVPPTTPPISALV